jgi:hypothetical protein
MHADFHIKVSCLTPDQVADKIIEATHSLIPTGSST